MNEDSLEYLLPRAVASGVLLELYSSSFCGACARTRDALDDVTRLVPGTAVEEVDVAFDPDRAEAVDIRSTPTVRVIDDDGLEVFRAEGVPTVPQVLAALARAVS